MLKRSASSVWTGNGKSGSGKVSVESGAMTGQAYNFNQRFGDEKGTNPEELIAAAHAACYNMKLSFVLAEAGMQPMELNTKATVTVDKSSGDWTITDILLDVRGRVQNGDAAKFQTAAEEAKKGCPISRVLNANITLNAVME